MKRIILIKTCTETQIAHLYEHMYCEAIRANFKSKKLLYYIDYTYQGTTYDKGLTHIVVDLYTPQAVELSGKLTNLNVTFEDAKLELAIAQIVAEEKHYLRASKKEGLISQLNELQDQPWEPLDDVVLFDAQQHRRTQRTLWLSEEKAKVKTLHCDLSLDNNFAPGHRNLLPLFDIVSNIIQENLARELCNKFGYYRNDNPAHYTRKNFKASQELAAWTRYTPSLTDEVSVCETTITWLVKIGLIERSAIFLGRAHYKQSDEAPDELRLLEATDILVGGRGWHQIGTEENISTVLKHTTLQLTYGKEKQSLALAPLLENKK